MSYKYPKIVLFLFFSSAVYAQRCPAHVGQIQSLFSQLSASGFDMKKPISYHYFFMDSNETDLNRFKNLLQTQQYKVLGVTKKAGKFQLEAEKIEAHTSASMIQKGNLLNDLAKANSIDSYDGFELNEVAEVPGNKAIEAQIAKISNADIFAKALDFYAKNDNETAKLAFDRCIKEGINLEASYYKRANCYTALGQTAKAIADLENCLRINPKNFEANYNIGGLYLDKKIFDKAIFYYQKASSINSKSDNSFYRLAEAYHKLGMKNEALQNCQKALQINASNEYAQILLKQLK